MYSEPSHTSTMEVFAKIVNSFKPLTIFARCSVLDIWQGILSKYMQFLTFNQNQKIKEPEKLFTLFKILRNLRFYSVTLFSFKLTECVNIRYAFGPYVSTFSLYTKIFWWDKMYFPRLLCSAVSVLVVDFEPTYYSSACVLNIFFCWLLGGFEATFILLVDQI